MKLRYLRWLLAVLLLAQFALLGFATTAILLHHRKPAPLIVMVSTWLFMIWTTRNDIKYLWK